MKNLFNYQFDFIKLRSQKVNREKVKWEMLNPHPIIRNAYTLDAKSGLHCKNFKLYLTKDDRAILELSVPYLLYGHNYIGVSGVDLENAFTRLNEMLGIDFMNANVIQFEFGSFAFLEEEAKYYIKNIVGVSGYNLKFKSSYMKMFGHKKMNFKIYDAVANAKKKKTFNQGNYPSEKLIKFELKIIPERKKIDPKFVLRYLFRPDMEQMMKKSLRTHISMITEVRTQINLNSDDNSLNQILFIALKNLQQQFDYPIYKLVLRIIDDLDLTPSQRSKRRKSFLELERRQNLINNI